MSSRLKTANFAGLELTPASLRVLQAATAWTQPPRPLSFPELLWGLLSETECRAADMLQERGVTAESIQTRWPEVSPHSANASAGEISLPGESAGQGLGGWSPEVERALRSAARRFSSFSPPLPLATEHLLLAILEADGEAAQFLRGFGFDADAIVAATCQQYEVSHEPLSVSELEEEAPATNAQSVAIDSQAVSDSPRAMELQHSPPLAVWRILDAAANRAREAVRVLEDYARFALDDRHLTQRLKTLRHALAAALSRLPATSLQAARDTVADVGTSLSTPSEATRADLAAVLVANGKRLQESLRSLEEYAKLVDPAVAEQCKSLRYHSYTLERSLQTAMRSAGTLEHAQLYVLIDGRESETAFVKLAQELIAAGVHVLQLRDKRLDDRTLLARARRLRELTRDVSTLFIMNDRADLAQLAEADGVHVGQEELSVAEARRIVGPDCLVGLSTHSLEQAQQAVLAGADYIGVGPAFASQTKQFAAFPGLELARAVAAEISLPAFVIGGITLDNLPQVLASGASRVAVAGGILAADNPGQAAQAFIRQLRG